MLQWIWWYLNGLKVVGDQRGATPNKIQLSYFWSDFENFTFIGILMKIHVIIFSNRFLKFLMVSWVIRGQRGQNRQF